jgi:hypothetical protein
MRNTIAELGITRDSTASTTVPLAPPLSPVLHTNPGVSGIAEAALDLEIDTGATIQVDTRPIWPGRPELFYKQYITEKEAWLAAHPDVQPASYRTARGLERYPVSWCNRNRIFLPRERLDLQTETLLEGSPNWTNEETSAWLDNEALKEQEVEQQVEAELIAAGGFGQSRERGVRGRWRQFRSDFNALREQYRFI